MEVIISGCDDVRDESEECVHLHHLAVQMGFIQPFISVIFICGFPVMVLMTGLILTQGVSTGP